MQRFETVTPNDIDSLVSVHIRLKSIEDFREYVSDQLKQYIAAVEQR